jgi:hypothetical protein
MIAAHARARGAAYEAKPQGEFFRRWEPHDTMVCPEAWYNACTYAAPWGGHVVVAEPWTTGEGLEPIERTLVAFVTVPWLTRRAAMRVGEPFLTRVAYLESPPPPKVQIGDKVWDEHVTTFAASASEALAAFPSSLRTLLRSRGFRGHLEMRPGGFVMHEEGTAPDPAQYDRAVRHAIAVAGALSAPASGGAWSR